MSNSLPLPSPSPTPAPPPGAARRACLLALPLAFALALAPAAAAAEAIPLSTLPETPARYATAAGKVHAEVRGYASSTADVAAAPPVCLIPAPPRYWIDGDADAAGGRFSTFSFDRGTTFGVERLAIRGDAAELERVVVRTLGRELAPEARSRISLLTVAKLDGLAVYAYRWHAQVYLIAQSTDDTAVRTVGHTELMGAAECGVNYALLWVRNGSSEVAQIFGRIPRTGKRYVVDASVSQTGRDPEPLLAVTARLIEP
jgi:hypothetical protein